MSDHQIWSCLTWLVAYALAASFALLALHPTTWTLVLFAGLMFALVVFASFMAASEE